MSDQRSISVSRDERDAIKEAWKLAYTDKHARRLLAVWMRWDGVPDEAIQEAKVETT